MNEISFRQLLKASWAMYKPIWGTFTILFLVLMVFGVAPSLMGTPSVIVSILTMVVSAFMSFLLGYLAVYTAHNEKVTPAQFFAHHTWSLFLTSIWASILLFLVLHLPFQLVLIFGIMAIGFGPVALVIGIVVTLLYLLLSLNVSFAKFLIIKPELKAWPAVKASWHLARKHQWKVVWVFIGMFFLNILGIIALGVGIFVTAPLSMIIMALLAKSLHTEDVPVVVSSNNSDLTIN